MAKDVHHFPLISLAQTQLTVSFDEFRGKVGLYQNMTGTLADDETPTPLRLEMMRWYVKGLEREKGPPWRLITSLDYILE